jgi:hypothetical protein
MSTYNLDAAKAKEGSGRVSNRINETGAYVGVIAVAKDVTAGTGSKGIELSFKTPEGLEASYLRLWTQNKDSEPIFGEKQLHALMTCLKVKTISAVERVITEFDPDLKKDVQKPAMVYLELMNKPVGIVLQLEEYENRNGEIKEKMSYFTSFEASTRKLAAEILDQKPAELLDKILKGLKDKRMKHKAAANTEAPAATADFDDEIPF